VVRHAATNRSFAGTALQTAQSEIELPNHYVVYMPPQLPGETQRDQLAVWMALYAEGAKSGEPDPVWEEAVATILRLIPTRMMPEKILP